MKTCNYCKKKMKDADLFCPRCGREYRDDLYIDKENYISHDQPDEVEAKKIPLPDFKKSPDLFILLLGLLVLFIFPMFSPLLIAFFFARLATNKKRSK
ncbi:MAG: hypothetical protein GX046_08085 [Tissierellia bacterium]|nr:hypothetical protein [Tissierellia bacterium]